MIAPFAHGARELLDERPFSKVAAANGVPLNDSERLCAATVLKVVRILVRTLGTNVKMSTTRFGVRAEEDETTWQRRATDLVNAYPVLSGSGTTSANVETSAARFGGRAEALPTSSPLLE